MKKPIKLLILISFCLALSACATVAQRQSLTMKNRSVIKSDKVLLNTTQREVVMQHNNWINSNLADPYAPMDSGALVHQNAGYSPNAGLLGALIVAGIHHHDAAKGVREMVAVNTALGNFNYVNYFNSELKQKVTTIPWLKVRKQSVRYDVTQPEVKLLSAAKENTTMFIGTTYALDSVFKQLEAVAYVKLAEKPKKGQQARTLYANNFYFIYRLKQSGNSTKAENKSEWIKNHAAFLKTKLRDAAIILSGLIAKDLQTPNVVPYKNIKKTVTLRTVNGLEVKGKLIKQEKGYDIIALKTGGRLNGYIYAVNRNDLVI